MFQLTLHYIIAPSVHCSFARDHAFGPAQTTALLSLGQTVLQGVAGGSFDALPQQCAHTGGALHTVKVGLAWLPLVLHTTVAD